MFQDRYERQEMAAQSAIEKAREGSFLGTSVGGEVGRELISTLTKNAIGSRNGAQFYAAVNNGGYYRTFAPFNYITGSSISDVIPGVKKFKQSFEAGMHYFPEPGKMSPGGEDALKLLFSEHLNIDDVTPTGVGFRSGRYKDFFTQLDNLGFDVRKAMPNEAIGNVGEAITEEAINNIKNGRKSAMASSESVGVFRNKLHGELKRTFDSSFSKAVGEATGVVARDSAEMKRVGGSIDEISTLVEKWNKGSYFSKIKGGGEGFRKAAEEVIKKSTNESGAVVLDDLVNGLGKLSDDYGMKVAGKVAKGGWANSVLGSKYFMLMTGAYMPLLPTLAVTAVGIGVSMAANTHADNSISEATRAFLFSKDTVIDKISEEGLVANEHHRVLSSSNDDDMSMFMSKSSTSKRFVDGWDDYSEYEKTVEADSY